ncbi:MAG: hypothetical protein R8G34_17795 [Paracoccaceae bacterium]|nr:hypothetical protein [Paracoccaceae bacterium]
MGRITYVEDTQLDLRARKRLAAWIVHLVGQAHLIEFSEDHTPDHKNYALTVKAQIDSALHEDGEAPEPISLIDFLEMYLKRVKAHTAAHEAETFVSAREKMGAMVEAFDCGQCGVENKWCKGGEADLFQFQHETGGRCLDFLRQITRRFIRQAELEYQRLLADGNDIEIVPPIMLATVRKKDAAGTLPVDGEFRQPNGKTDAVMQVYLPMDDALGDAIHSLPYLIFHEVFVHGAQGAALNGARFQVDQDCAFTEGAVDAVACEILQAEVLSDKSALPKLLQPMANAFWQASYEYHLNRYKMPEVGANDPGDDIRRARASGRNDIYRFLVYLRKLGGKPKGWAEQVILTLNLYMTREERSTFYLLMKQAKYREEHQIALIDPLHQFIMNKDVAAMMRTIRRNLGLKMHVH